MTQSVPLFLVFVVGDKGCCISPEKNIVHFSFHVFDSLSFYIISIIIVTCMVAWNKKMSGGLSNYSCNKKMSASGK